MNLRLLATVSSKLLLTVAAMSHMAELGNANRPQQTQVPREPDFGRISSPSVT